MAAPEAAVLEVMLDPTQPFAPKTLGYQRAPGYPAYDSDDAKQFLDECTSELGTNELRFTLGSTPDPPVQALANALKEQLAKLGALVEGRYTARPYS